MNDYVNVYLELQHVSDKHTPDKLDSSLKHFVEFKR